MIEGSRLSSPFTGRVEILNLQTREEVPAYSPRSVDGQPSYTPPHQIPVIPRLIIFAYRCRANSLAKLSHRDRSRHIDATCRIQLPRLPSPRGAVKHRQGGSTTVLSSKNRGCHGGCGPPCRIDIGFTHFGQNL